MSDPRFPDDGFDRPEPDAPEPEAGPFRPLQEIWLAPRRTIRLLVEYDPSYLVVPLVGLAGIYEALSRSSGRSAGDHMNLTAILIVSLIAGPLSGWLSLWISSHLLAFTGRWLDGTAPRDHLRTAIGWSALPSVVGLGLILLQVAIFGDELFRSATPHLDASAGQSALLMAFTIAESVLSVWSLVLLAKTVAEVQGFRSAWLGLGNAVIAGLVVLAPIVVMLALVAVIAKLA